MHECACARICHVGGAIFFWFPVVCKVLPLLLKPKGMNSIHIYIYIGCTLPVCVGGGGGGGGKVVSLTLYRT